MSLRWNGSRIGSRAATSFGSVPSGVYNLRVQTTNARNKFWSGVSISSPNEISNLSLWFDADDSSTVLNSISPETGATNGQAIRRWKDKGANSLHFNQTTANNQPLYQTNQINGKAAISFDGTNDSFTFSGEATTVYSAFFVFKRAVNNVVSIGFGGSGSLFPFIGTGRDSYLKASNATVNIRTTTETGVMMFSVVRDIASETAYFNGTAIANSPNNDQASNNSRASFGTGAGVFHNGLWAEVITYSKSLSNRELNAVHSYLNAKWAIY